MAGSPKLPLRSNSATYDDGGLEAKSERSVRGFFKGPRSAIAVRSGCVKRNSSAVKYGRDLRQHLPNEKSETRLWGTGSTKTVALEYMDPNNVNSYIVTRKRKRVRTNRGDIWYKTGPRPPLSARHSSFSSCSHYTVRQRTLKLDQPSST